MMESDSVHGKPPMINTTLDDDGTLKITDDKGDQPPQKPLTPVRSYTDTSNTFEDDDSSIENTASDKPQGKDAVDVPAPVASVFSFGRLASSLPVTYLSYFNTKPATPAATSSITSESSEATEEDSKADIEGGVVDETDGKDSAPAVGGNRTWAEWAKEKSVGKEAPEYLTMLHESSTVEIDVPARSTCRAPFLVPKGSAIIWTVRVRLLDLGFAVRLRRQGLGGAVEDDIVPMQRILAGETVTGGRAAVDYPRHIVFVFDNAYSKLRAKKCAHRVQVGPHVTCEDESVLAGPDVMASPFADPVTSPTGAPQGQLAALSALLDRAKESYVAVLGRAKQAGEVSIGAVHGGIVVAAGAPMMLQRTIVASLRKNPPGGAGISTDSTGDGQGASEGESAASAEGGEVVVEGVPVSQLSDAALLPVLDMDNFCALWVQLEEGCAEISSTVIPRPAIEEGFPLSSFPQHISSVGGVHVLASGEIAGGCQIFGYTTTSATATKPADSADEAAVTETLSYYVLVEITVSWRGPSQESPGYDDWTLKASVRTPCPDKMVLKTVVDSLKLSDAFFIIV